MDDILVPDKVLEIKKQNKQVNLWDPKKHKQEQALQPSSLTDSRGY